MNAPTTFRSSLQFNDSWRASREQIDALLTAMISSLQSQNARKIDISGNIVEGRLDVAFDIAEVARDQFHAGLRDDDFLVALVLVIRALNAGRVSAPGWPDDKVTDGAIASIRFRCADLVYA